MSKTVVIVLGVVLLAGIAFMVVKSQNRNPPVSGAVSGPASGPAPQGAGRTGSKVTNTINDVLGFAKQGVEIANLWNTNKKAM